MTSNQITSAVVWRVRPEKAREFEDILRQMINAAATYSGVRGVHAVSPNPGGEPIYRLVVAFDSEPSFQSWQDTLDSNPWMIKARALAISPEDMQVRSGLEAWFNDPTMAAPAARQNPATYKTAVLMWAVLFPLTLFFRWLFVLFPLPFSPLGQTGLMMAVEILIVSYLVMPQIARLFSFWLYPASKARV